MLKVLLLITVLILGTLVNCCAKVAPLVMRKIYGTAGTAIVTVPELGLSGWSQNLWRRHCFYLKAMLSDK